MTRLSNALKRSIMIFVSAAAIFFMIAYVSVTPRPGEQFFQIYVLGENKMAERYYPNDNPNIPIGVQVKWHLGATNFMGSIQYVILKIKLSNTTIDPPDEKNNLPSPAPVVKELYRVMLNNETWQFPLTWSINDLKRIGDNYYPTQLIINEQKIDVQPVSAKKGYNYRMIVELWTLDPLDQHLIFGWRTGTERKTAWLQVWFNATLPKAL